MNILDNHLEIWKKKPLLREIYTEWYEKIMAFAKPGKVVEIGSGTGNLKEIYPKVITTDIDSKPWLDMVFDAHKPPFKKESVDSYVMIDVLHHMQDPVTFLNNSHKTLKKKGRIVMVEPYPSFFSLIIYKIFHPEPFIFNVNPFRTQKSIGKHPWESNQALPFLLFFKRKKEFKQLMKNKFDIVKIEKFSFILYPLSGGFENKSFIPLRSLRFFQKVEKLFVPLASIFAFRCFVVLEKK